MRHSYVFFVDLLRKGRYHKAMQVNHFHPSITCRSMCYGILPPFLGNSDLQYQDLSIQKTRCFLELLPAYLRAQFTVVVFDIPETTENNAIHFFNEISSFLSTVDHFIDDLY